MVNGTLKVCGLVISSSNFVSTFTLVQINATAMNSTAANHSTGQPLAKGGDESFLCFALPTQWGMSIYA